MKHVLLPVRTTGPAGPTPGRVVCSATTGWRSSRTPRRPGRVHAVPLLASPPWINKYYVTDLSPGRSFLEWAVTHQRTVFAISYRNPRCLDERYHARFRRLTGDLAALGGS